jgi:hypothetical protein
MAPRYLAVPSGSCDVKVKHSLQEFAQVILTHFLITIILRRLITTNIAALAFGGHLRNSYSKPALGLNQYL